MRNEDQSQARLGRKGTQQTTKSFQPPGGRTDGDNRETDAGYITRRLLDATSILAICFFLLRSTRHDWTPAIADSIEILN
jgi:hypothetical protein